MCWVHFFGKDIKFDDFAKTSILQWKSKVVGTLVKTVDRSGLPFQLSPTIEPKANSKWERDLQIDQSSLKHFFSRVKNVCKDNNLREFYFKLLHRIVVTKEELVLFGIAEDIKCPYCEMNDSIIHTFHNSNWSQLFFSEVTKRLNKENVTSFTL